ncbi:MAG: HAMP domain-containing sensor histidine kinase [Sphingomonas phyllosphaerae]|uniref:sensor histidine kinase n=1 Tax=Sphingomonas phyllosphaerae TaxID=257003 RepID=UPI002FF5FDE1
MGSRRRWVAIGAALGLVACGIAATIAWQAGLWGLLTGAILVSLWLAALNYSTVVRPRGAAAPIVSAGADAQAIVLRVLLDAAPTPLLGIEGTTGRALNRAARQLFATDDHVLPLPTELADPCATHLRHEGRSWRIDRVTVTGGGDVAALIDIEQEERVAEARATADLIQVLGHELLNGLSPIVSLADSGAAAIERPVVDIDLLREILGTLSRRAEGLQRFTEGYRALARLPAPTRALVRLREMADDLARLFIGRWPAASLSIEVADDLCWPLDRDQLDQAIWALLQNAAEAADSDTDARVTLRMYITATGLTIEIEDAGAGVPPDAATRIFRPFHTTKPDGTGIGLSLARQIALAHGGTLTLQSHAPTRFRLTLS